MLTLRELVDSLGLTIVAAASGSERRVRWVHTSELTDPTPWLSGSEVILTTGMRLGSPQAQRDYVRLLLAHGISGIGFGTGLGHDTVPQALAEEAESVGLAVFEVPYEVPFIAISERAAEHSINEQFAQTQRARLAHERLEKVLVSEGGLSGLTTELSQLLPADVAVYGTCGDALACSGADPAADLSILRAVGYRLAASDPAAVQASRPQAVTLETGQDAIALPVARLSLDGDDATLDAWLFAAKQAGQLSELDRLILWQSVTLVALELVRRRVAEETERRLAGDVLDAALEGQLEAQELARRLEPFGLREQVGAFVMPVPDEGVAVLDRAISVALRERAGGRGLVAARGDLVCALMQAPPSGDPADFFALAEGMRAQISTDIGQELCAGVGRCGPPADLRRIFHEARCALEARTDSATKFGADAGIATYQDLGSAQLLLSMQDQEALKLFCDSILGPIIENEGAYGGELLRSLEAFIECHGQWEKAARRLYCHRHTLRYRIRRVEELTGRSLDDVRDRIDFWLALRGRQIAGTLD